MKPQLELLEDRTCPSSFLDGPVPTNHLSAPVPFVPTFNVPNFPYIITELTAPPNLNNDFAAMIDTQILLFLGQFPQLHMGIQYLGPNQVIRYDVTPQQWDNLMAGYPQSTSRGVIPMALGTIPIIFVPTDVASPGDQSSRGEQWELTSLMQGWYYTDATPADFPPNHVYDLSYMPPGPQFGQGFIPINTLFLDWEVVTFLQTGQFV